MSCLPFSSAIRAFLALGLALGLATAPAARADSYDFQTLDDPAAPSGILPQGISGSTVVGCFNDSNNTSHGFIFDSGNFTTLDDPHADAGASQGTFAQAIDGANIAGFYTDANGSSYGFIYNGTAFANFTLKAAPKTTTVFGLSGKNLVGTYYVASTRRSYGFFYNGTTAKSTAIAVPAANVSLGTFPQGVQENSVVGYYFTSNGKSAPASSHGFLYANAKYTTLNDPNAGPLGTYAEGIYNGTVVGFYFDANGVNHGFVYDGASFTDLDVPNATETLAYGINNGNIVGNFYDSQNALHGFLATPTPIPAAITADPVNATVYATTNATFSIQYTGLPIPTIQWQISTDGGSTWSNLTSGNFSGFTSATLTVIQAPLSLTNAQFRAVVTNSSDSSASTPVTLTVNPVGNIVINSLGTNLDATQEFSGITYILANHPVTFSVATTGPGNLSYQWFLKGKAIAKATAANYTLAKFAAASAGNYTVRIHSSLPTANLTSANLTTALGVAPKISLSPASVTVANGGNATFSVAATGAPAPSFQWQISTNSGASWSNITGGNFSGFTSANLTATNVTVSGLQFKAVAGNVFGAATSKTVTLTVTPPVPTLDPALQGNYTITSMAVNLEGEGNVPITLSSLAQAYTVTLGPTGLAGAASSIEASLFKFAGVTTPPTMTVTSATPTTYKANVSGNTAFNNSSIGSVSLKSVSGTVVGNLVSPGIITMTTNMGGTVSLLGISLPGPTLGLTIVLTKE